jgi:hypothetical protein
MGHACVLGTNICNFSPQKVVYMKDLSKEAYLYKPQDSQTALTSHTALIAISTLVWDCQQAMCYTA